MKKEFQLGALRHKKPLSLIDDNPSNDRDVDRFFLIMALMFNDIKGLVFFDNWLHEYREPQKEEISGHAGEWHGIKLQRIKLLAAILSEFLNVLEEYKNIINTDPINRYEQQLSRQDKSIWDLFLEVTKIHPTKLSDERIEVFKKMLIQIRANVTFHYYGAGKPLANGFRDHFYKKFVNQPAYYSAQGTNFYKTRYYYADAAIQSYLESCMTMAGEADKVLETITDLTVKASKVINGLMEQYLKEKLQV
ncbi:MAG: hypothetical protein A2729_00575 [Candidatus Buchananbacteria bacterium RIFCSPHIGHO2_01_FULL_39_14]|uniref:Uncharacterized protein n=1 Tax=Candidatus Buchananbacteria bacterium RIFCSPHIGHO2_01_FULL_39_14 TaxID=1797532 RepID=A0A1G1Y175_9BACT|nr:MAG: hypothetical protein A2729_00575 [Candidatus Buchananbacteria bacterium RIFCSPHIGHO2_01_FULL_39_14]OGY48709.1 MAG: hypothetical protein A3D39_04525 [Candidatus Buchananbacteria bacterium RIFCSPHIGHO2_02_FULL_39_17]